MFAHPFGFGILAATCAALALTSTTARAQGSLQVQLPPQVNLLIGSEVTIVGGVGYLDLPKSDGTADVFVSFSLASGVLLDADGPSGFGAQPGSLAILAPHDRLVTMNGVTIALVDISHPEDLKLAGSIALPCGLVGAGGLALAPDGHTGYASTVYSCVHSFDIDTLSVLDPDGFTTPGGGGQLGVGQDRVIVLHSGGNEAYVIDSSDPTDLRLLADIVFAGESFGSVNEVQIADDLNTAWFLSNQGVLHSVDLASGQVLNGAGLALGNSYPWLDRHGNVLALNANAALRFIDISDPAAPFQISSAPLASIQQSIAGGTAFSGDGQRFAAATLWPFTGVVAVEVATGQVVAGPIAIGDYPVQTAVFGPDERVLALCMQSDTVHLAWGLLAPIEPATWCLGKPNSQGCAPAVRWLGAPSASAAQSFVVEAERVVPWKYGVLLYGLAPSFTPFASGHLCVAPPQKRTALEWSGGNPALACSGEFRYDFNAYVQSGVDPALVAGAMVYAQYLYRDPASSGAIGLSDALQFLIAP